MKVIYDLFSHLGKHALRNLVLIQSRRLFKLTLFIVSGCNKFIIFPVVSVFDPLTLINSIFIARNH